MADRRAAAPHISMFLRMLMRAAVLRRGRAASALLAMVVAAAVATAMMNLYVDVQAKLRKEFRSYGANVVVVGKDGTSLPPDAIGKAGNRPGRPRHGCPLRVRGRAHCEWPIRGRGRHRFRTRAEARSLVVSECVAFGAGEALVGMRALRWSRPTASLSISAFRATRFTSTQRARCKPGLPKTAGSTCP